MALLKRSFSTLAILFLTAFVTMALATENSLSGIFTTRLTPISPSALAFIPHDSHKGTILSFYSPDCAWCERQIKSLNEFQQHCGAQWVTVLVGIKGDKRALRTPLRKTQNILPAFIATQDFLKLFPILEATPITIFLDKNNEVRLVKRGYSQLQNQPEIPCEGFRS